MAPNNLEKHQTPSKSTFESLSGVEIQLNVNSKTSSILLTFQVEFKSHTFKAMQGYSKAMNLFIFYYYFVCLLICLFIYFIGCLFNDLLID